VHQERLIRQPGDQLGAVLGTKNIIERVAASGPGPSRGDIDEPYVVVAKDCARPYVPREPDDGSAVRPPVDQVAGEEEKVGALIESQPDQQSLERTETALHITDEDSPNSAQVSFRPACSIA
jgi:hypothetical protein